MEKENYLLGYQGLKIIQNSDMFNFSLDSILLPNFVTLSTNLTSVLDIGCGNAPIPMILSTKTRAHITGIEIQKESVDLAIKSIEKNHLENQISIIHGDVRTYPLPLETFEVIVCNPPFFKVSVHSRLNDQDAKTIARHEVKLTLSDVLKVARKCLKNQGVVAMVHRPERLVDILVEMRKQNIEPKRIQFVYPRIGMESHILLVEGKKNGKPGIKILPPLYVHEKDGEYTDMVKEYFKN